MRELEISVAIAAVMISVCLLGVCIQLRRISDAVEKTDSMLRDVTWCMKSLGGPKTNEVQMTFYYAGDRR